MFTEFTGKNGKAVRIDTEAILAVEEIDGGSRIHIGATAIEVRETVEAVMAELDSEDDEEDDD